MYIAVTAWLVSSSSLPNSLAASRTAGSLDELGVDGGVNVGAGGEEEEEEGLPPKKRPRRLLPGI